MGIITASIVEYPVNQLPNIYADEAFKFEDKTVELVRYMIGKKGDNPLVGICMNPSAATMLKSDRMVNRFIEISRDLGRDGWILFNLYPERGTNPSNQQRCFSDKLMDNNIRVMKESITEYHINEILLGWGAPPNGVISNAEARMLCALDELVSRNEIQLICLGNLLKGHPRYISPRNPNHDKLLKVSDNDNEEWDLRSVTITNGQLSTTEE